MTRVTARGEKRIEHRTVREVMTPVPKTVDPRMSLRMLTKLDFLKMFAPDRRRWIPDLRALWAKRVEDIMSRGIIAVEPDDTIATAADLMVQSRLRTLPVVRRRGRERRLVGVVSRTDLLKCLLLPDETAGGHVSDARTSS